MTTLPLPPRLWQKFLQFLTKGRYGKIEFDVADGQVINVRWIEQDRVRDWVD